jgi:hypothetical protein
MMENINEERDEIAVLQMKYKKYQEAVSYYIEVAESNRGKSMNESDCLSYWGYAKDNFVTLANGMDTERAVSLTHLQDACNSLKTMADISLLTCTNQITKESYEVAVSFYAELKNRALESEKAFLNSANALIDKYNSDLYVYGAQVTEETKRKYEFWSQFASALASGLSSGLSSPARSSSFSGTTVYSPDECIGPVIMGECKGTILPKGGYHEKCYGTWLNGECIGPQF